MNAKDMHEKYEVGVYPKRDICIVKGKGARVWDDAGKEYIDCAAGIGVANIGHCNSHVADAISRQARELITCPGIFYNDTRARLLELLVGISPNLEQAFLCNSGTESVEAALKFARYTTRREEFVCLMRGFHGRTYGSLSATFKKTMKDGFQPLVPGFRFVPMDDMEMAGNAITEKTAGVVMELIQGEGGVRPASQEYVHEIRRLCDEAGALLIIDEVQTGFCRTGTMFACEQYNVKPDILCLAKAIASGIPMGATLCTNNVKMDIGKHGSTFGGNPLACAAAIATIEYMEQENLAAQAREKGEYFMQLFSDHNIPIVREIRQVGLMIGIELREKSQPHILRLMEKGILALPAGSTVIRLLPPLTISREDIEEVVAALVQVLTTAS